MTALERAAVAFDARRRVHEAAASWSDSSIVVLARLVGIGEPGELLLTQQRSVAGAAEGRRDDRRERPAVTTEAWARAEVLGAWRALGAELPPPSDVFAALEVV